MAEIKPFMLKRHLPMLSNIYEDSVAILGVIDGNLSKLRKTKKLIDMNVQKYQYRHSTTAGLLSRIFVMATYFGRKV